MIFMDRGDEEVGFLSVAIKVVIGAIIVIVMWNVINNIWDIFMGGVDSESKRTFSDLTKEIGILNNGENGKIIAKLKDDYSIVGFGNREGNLVVDGNCYDAGYVKEIKAECKSCICLCRLSGAEVCKEKIECRRYSGLDFKSGDEDRCGGNFVILGSGLMMLEELFYVNIKREQNVVSFTLSES